MLSISMDITISLTLTFCIRYPFCIFDGRFRFLGHVTLFLFAWLYVRGLGPLFVVLGVLGRRLWRRRTSFFRRVVVPYAYAARHGVPVARIRLSLLHFQYFLLSLGGAICLDLILELPQITVDHLHFLEIVFREL